VLPPDFATAVRKLGLASKHVPNDVSSSSLSSPRKDSRRGSRHYIDDGVGADANYGVL
jgi:hypothetical protein